MKTASAKFSGPQAVQLRQEHWRSAAERLVATTGVNGATIRAAADRFLISAGSIGIDMRLSWGVLDPTGRNVREVCLAVLSPGRAAMLLTSGNSESPIKAFPFAGRLRRSNEEHTSHDMAEVSQPNSASHQSPTNHPRYPRHADRVACITAATNALSNCSVKDLPIGPDSAPVIAQALLEQKEKAGIASFQDAGYLQVGQLAYLKYAVKEHGQTPPQPDPNDWPPGIRVVPLSSIPEREQDETLVRSLEQTYTGTLDCPELCGLRSTRDVLESHKAVGEYNPTLWWIVYHNDQPAGCSLLSINPSLSAAELVYFGLAPSIRGKGLASPLLRLSMQAACRSTRAGVRSVLCAVDLRNTPALRLYKRAGFEQTQIRIPMIKKLTDHPAV